MVGSERHSVVCRQQWTTRSVCFTRCASFRGAPNVPTSFATNSFAPSQKKRRMVGPLTVSTPRRNGRQEWITLCSTAARNATSTSTNPATIISIVPFLTKMGRFAGIRATIQRTSRGRQVIISCFYFAMLNLCFVVVMQKALYFPMHKRLRSLFRIPGFKKLLEYESTRPTPDRNVMSDIFDSPEWKKLMGPPQRPCKAIGLTGCSDGFQAYVSGSLSIKPVAFSISSLPPALRFKSAFMILLMLLPSNVKGYGLKKYFDFSCNFELKALFYTGKHYFMFAFCLHYRSYPIIIHTHRHRWNQGENIHHADGHDWTPRTPRSAGSDRI